MLGEWWGYMAPEPLKISIVEDNFHGWECDFCGQELQQGEPLYLIFCDEYGAFMAHTSCKDKNSQCPTCRGKGWVRIPGVPADTLRDLLGAGIRSTEQCPVCNGNKYISNTTVMGQVLPITKEIDDGKPHNAA
jgi:hypothetical protein